MGKGGSALPAESVGGKVTEPDGLADEVCEGDDVCEREARPLAVSDAQPVDEREGRSNEKRAEADSVLPTEGVAALPEGDNFAEDEKEALAVVVTEARGECVPPMGFNVGNGAFEPSRFPEEADGAPEFDGAVESEGEAEGERDMLLDAVPVPRTFCPAVGKGSQEPSMLAAVAVGARGVREGGALRLLAFEREGVSLLVPPMGLSVGKGAWKPRKLPGERVAPLSRLAEGDAESVGDGLGERVVEGEDVGERETRAETLELTQLVSVLEGVNERDAAVVTEFVGCARVEVTGDVDFSEVGVGARGVRDTVPVAEAATESVFSGLSVGSGVSEGSAVAEGAREGDLIVE